MRELIIITVPMSIDRRITPNASRAIKPLSKRWIQKPGTAMEHYDLNEYKRSMAVRFGAVEVGPREMVALFDRKRSESCPAEDHVSGPSTTN